MLDSTVIALILALVLILAWIFFQHHPAAWDRARDSLRAAPLAVLFLVCLGVVIYHYDAPQKAGLSVFGISRIAMGGFVGYWVDRLCFRNEDRPHLLDGIARGTAWKRRAIIIAACIVAAAFVP